MDAESSNTLPVGRVVLLNGVGSAGKSSLAKAMQSVAAKPLLHVQMDAFLEMLPEIYCDHPQTFAYRPLVSDGVTEVAIESGPLGDRVLHGMRRSIREMAMSGLDLVVDDVLLGRGDPGFGDYRKLLASVPFRTVGVFAELTTLEERERRRGDRRLGLARWQFGRVHDGVYYDLIVHTDRQTPDELAKHICRALAL